MYGIGMKRAIFKIEVERLAILAERQHALWLIHNSDRLGNRCQSRKAANLCS